jgi:hypothetical protein
MPCAEYAWLRQQNQVAILAFRTALEDLVVLINTSGADSDFTLVHWRIRATRNVCERAQAALEHHRQEHGCQNSK